MGLHKPLGLPFKGEAIPKIPYPTDSDWDGLDLPWMAFGYGVLMTPLQTLTFYNAIANGGEMVKPKFIDRISNFGETPVKYFEKEVLNPSICSQETLQTVQKMMLNVVDKKWGTGYRIKDENFSIAGKTGTCQVDYTTEETQYVSSFVGYFPADEPKYSCIVVIHRPNKNIGYYGATVAAPVFKEIALNIYNSTPKEIKVPELRFTETEDLLEDEYKLITEEVIPNLKGMPAMDALMLLERMGLKVELKGTGKVIRQSIKKGSKVKVKQQILLELS
jgi:cell division protein FtsI (penicillin-binding protein 3)